MNKVTILILLLINITSCSFQSSQYNLIKGMINKEDSLQKPSKTWSIFWNNKQTDLYAINVANQIIFANDDINIFYKDQQIYKITGLLADDKLMEIDSNDSKLLYKLNGKQIASDSCATRKMTVGETEYKKYSHICFEQESGVSYENQIVINPEGWIVSLRFKVHPSYPLLELSIK